MGGTLVKLAHWREPSSRSMPGLRSLIRVRTERRGSRGRQRAVRYCVSRRPMDAEALLALVRGHWDVENSLHRTLDMQFREADGRLGRGSAPITTLRLPCVGITAGWAQN